MNKSFVALAVISLTSLINPACAKIPSNLKKEDIENIYIKTYDNKDYKFDDNDEEINENPSFQKDIKKDTLPRLKRIYIAGYGGYFYTKENNFEFAPTDNCKVSYNFICNNDKSINPIKTEAKDEYFLTGAFGINSENPLRLELSYYKMGKALELDGNNQVNLNTINYKSKLDLDGGSANIYFDFVLNRRKPSFIFTPYAMAGIGISNINLSDITFKGQNNHDITIKGKEQRNKTVIYGAGLTAGINNYISLDIGYRYYDFGTIKTSNKMIDSVVDNSDPLNPITTNTEYDLELQSDFDAHIAVIGLKIQI